MVLIALSSFQVTCLKIVYERNICTGPFLFGGGGGGGGGVGGGGAGVVKMQSWDIVTPDGRYKVRTSPILQCCNNKCTRKMLRNQLALIIGCWGQQSTMISKLIPIPTP